MPVPVVLAGLGKLALVVAPTISSNLFANRARKKQQQVIVPKGATGLDMTQLYTYGAVGIMALLLIKKKN